MLLFHTDLSVFMQHKALLFQQQERDYPALFDQLNTAAAREHFHLLSAAVGLASCTHTCKHQCIYICFHSGFVKSKDKLPFTLH